MFLALNIRAQKTQEIDSLEQIYNKGNRCVCYAIGEAYVELENYKSAIEWFDKCNEPYSKQELSDMEEDFDCYVAEYKGMCNIRLGDCYYEGNGGDDGCKKAFRYYKKSIASGFYNCPGWLVDRMYARLGSLYQDGFGTCRNLKKAFKCYSIGCQRYGGEMCMYEMAICYLNGWGTGRDIREGIDLLYQCAFEGDSDAESLLKELKITHPKWFEEL